MDPPEGLWCHSDRFQRCALSLPHGVILVGAMNAIERHLAHPLESTVKIIPHIDSQLQFALLGLDALPGIIHASVIMVLTPKFLQFIFMNHHFSVTTQKPFRVHSVMRASGDKVGLCGREIQWQCTMLYKVLNIAIELSVHKLQKNYRYNLGITQL